jgi:hypothetical protein
MYIFRNIKNIKNISLFDKVLYLFLFKSYLNIYLLFSPYKI